MQSAPFSPYYPGLENMLCKSSNSYARLRITLYMYLTRLCVTKSQLAALQKLIAKVTELVDTVASFADHFTSMELTFARAIGDEIDVKRPADRNLARRSRASRPIGRPTRMITSK